MQGGALGRKFPDPRKAVAAAYEKERSMPATSRIGEFLARRSAIGRIGSPSKSMM